ncbi:MAG: uracil-DNA glycosylase, partial [Methylorubrum rhodinum]
MNPSHPEPDSRADLISYLDFHVEAGVDAALDEAPHDRFGEAEAAPQREPAPR